MINGIINFITTSKMDKQLYQNAVDIQKYEYRNETTDFIYNAIKSGNIHNLLKGA